MAIDPLIIYGSGGHAKVVLDAWRLSTAQAATIPCYLYDDNADFWGQQIAGITILNQTECHNLIAAGAAFHIAIGKNKVRQRLYHKLQHDGLVPMTIRHPLSVMAWSAKLGEGSFLAATAVLGPDANVGQGCIVNHGAVIDHDCQIGEFCHIAPNATLGGGVKLGNNVLIGAGAVVLPGLIIGDDAVIGAGALIRHHVEKKMTMVAPSAQQLIPHSPTLEI